SIDNYPSPWPERIVSIRTSNTRRILGVSVTLDEIEKLLKRLHFEIKKKDRESVQVVVPSWRTDIVEEADLIEEVARLYGYERIGQGWKFRTTSFAEKDPFDEFMETTGSHLCARGHTEILVSSFTDGHEGARLGLDDRRARPIAIRNPLSANHSYLRTTLLAGALDVIRRNIDHGTRHLRVYTSGAVFLPSAEDGGGLPDEPMNLLTAHTRPAGSDFWNDLKRRVDLFDIKQEIETILALHHIDPSALDYSFDASEGQFSYRGRDEVVIQGGVIPARMARELDLEQPVWYAEINMEALFGLRPPRLTHRAISGYPASRRDLSLLTPEGVTYDRIEKSLAKNGGRLIESIQVFDVYRGDELPGGTMAIGVRLLFRSSDGTLTDADVDTVVDRMLTKLNSELGVALRS
ncbi:MAG: hypothetical protein IH969_02370, partial [Candidatus Krumholzibacteriota bacterium]|nr:hypothetical protein [Candidatus Krumholzibacteriota bacterium]